MIAQVIYAPHPIPNSNAPKVFLAGSIEMGKAEDWQSKLIEYLADVDCVILNPRRPDWDNSWKQTKDDPQFSQQVNWELDGLNRAQVMAFYFAPGTMSPISLLELGLHAHTHAGHLILCCPPGFQRKGNVDIVAQRCYIPVHEDFDSFAAAVKRALT